jgi:hypothetical protein
LHELFRHAVLPHKAEDGESDGEAGRAEHASDSKDNSSWW